MALFGRELAVRVGDKPSMSGRYLALEDRLAGIHAMVQPVAVEGRARSIGRLHETDDPSSPFLPAASVSPLGRGRIAAIHFNYGDRYLLGRTSIARDFLRAVVREVFPEPAVEVRGSHSVDVSLGRNHDKLLINLVNTAGPHESEKQYTFDDIPAVGPLEVAFRATKEPKSVVRQPAGEVLPVDWRDGVARVRVPGVALYDILVVTE
jgi:hypothetical protein